MSKQILDNFLDNFLDNIDVQNKWSQNSYINWLTGEKKPDGTPDESFMTHCSAFVASVCTQLNVPILRPPEHNTEGLANAQHDWLISDGSKYGWYRIMSGEDAQNEANNCKLVLVAYRNHLNDKGGHIAILRSANTDTDNELQVCQAGLVNSIRRPLSLCFIGDHKDKCKYFGINYVDYYRMEPPK